MEMRGSKPDSLPGAIVSVAVQRCLQDGSIRERDTSYHTIYQISRHANRRHSKAGTPLALRTYAAGAHDSRILIYHLYSLSRNNVDMVKSLYALIMTGELGRV
jgi:hypothetical protein